MPTAVIVDAVRTPQGRRNGALKDVHPVDLAALTLDALIQRTSLDPELVEDVIMGCVMQVGDQAVNAGRNAALAAGFPESTVGTTVDRQCGSSQQAAHFAAQGVIAGAYDVVVAAGVESMTRVPMGASFTPGSQPFGPKVFARYQERGGLVPQGISAEMIADKWGLSRDDLDALSVQSHKRAARATEEGRFEKEIIPITVETEEGKEEFARDQGIRPDSSMESLANQASSTSRMLPPRKSIRERMAPSTLRSTGWSSRAGPISRATWASSVCRPSSLLRRSKRANSLSETLSVTLR